MSEARIPFRLADLYTLRHVSDPAVSPDGRRVAFVVQGYRKKDNDRYQNIWLARTDGAGEPHRLTRGASSDGSPAWSADSRYLAFLSTREHEVEVAAVLAEEEEAKKSKEKGKAEAAGGDPGTAEGAGEAGDDGGGDNDKPKPQIWILDTEFGGEPREITWREEGVSEFDWSPDGRQLVFAARDPDAKQKKYLKSVRGGEKGKDRGPIVLDRVQHKHDGIGYLDDVRTHLFVVEVASRAARRLTRGPGDERSPRWSPDGRWILFVSNRTGDADNNLRLDLWLIRPDGGETRRLTFGDVGADGPRWSPDSRQVAFVSTQEPENLYRTRHLMTVTVDGAEPVEDLAACIGQGWSTVGGVVPDQPAGTGDPVRNARVYPMPLRRTPVRVLTADLDRWVMAAPMWVGAGILILVGDGGQTRLALVSFDGGAGGDPGAGASRDKVAITFPIDDRLCDIPSADAAGGVVVFRLERPAEGDNLYAMPAAGTTGSVAGSGAAGTTPAPAPVRLTRLNEDLLSRRLVARYERITFRDSDGVAVEAIVALPAGFDPGVAVAGASAAGGAATTAAPTPPPLLVSIHGGPMWYDSPGFDFAAQYWAGRGYTVLMVNYRGSISYGEAFTKVIRGDWGPREHDDVMSGVDEVVRRGWADPARLYCTGFSQGGIMTNWAVGHTDRFRAAVSEHGMWDYVAAFGTDDCHLWWQDDLGVPWQNQEQYRRISPVSAVAGIKTPLLIMAGEVDWRCPLNQSEQLYLALKKRGVPTGLIIYQGERHNINRPKRAIDRLRRICQWLAKYGGPAFDDDSAEGYADA